MTTFTWFSFGFTWVRQWWPSSSAPAWWWPAPACRSQPSSSAPRDQANKIMEWTEWNGMECCGCECNGKIMIGRMWRKIEWNFSSEGILLLPSKLRRVGWKLLNRMFGIKIYGMEYNKMKGRRNEDNKCKIRIVYKKDVEVLKLSGYKQGQRHDKIS